VSRRWGIAATVVVLVLGLSAGLAWWALPQIVQWVLVRQIESSTGRKVTLERFELDVRAGHLGMGGFRLADRESGAPLAEFERLVVRFQPRDLIRGHLHVTEATLASPRVSIVRAENGSLNIADLLASAERHERPTAVTVDRLTLSGGAVTFEDRTLRRHRTWRADGIEGHASALSTVDDEARGTAHLTATVAGAPVVLDATEVRLSPLRARGRLEVRSADATLAQLYVSPDAPLVLDHAILTAALDGVVDAAEGLQVVGQGRVDGIVLRRRGTDVPLVAVPYLRFTLQGGDAPDAALRLARLEVTGAATVFDQRTSPPTRFEVPQLRLAVEDVTAGGASPARVTLDVDLPRGAGLDAQGTVRFAPLAASLRTRVKRLDVAVLGPLLALPGRLDGVVESELDVDVTDAPGPAARVRGRATVSGVAFADGQRPLATARQVEVTGVDAQWPRLRVQRVHVSRPVVVLERDGEGRLPLLALLAPAGPPARAAATPPPLEIDIGEIAMDQATATFDDAAVTPPARLRVSPLRLVARDVTWPGRRPARVQLTAATPRAGTLTAEGTVSLDPLRFDVRAKAAGVRLGPYQPYVPLPARIRGRLDADVAVAGALTPRVDLKVRGTAGLSNVTFSEGNRRMLAVTRLQVSGLDYAWPATARIDRFHVQGSWAMLERRADGTVPIAALFTPVRPAPGPAASASDTPVPVDIAVRESLLEGGTATIVDGAVSPPARFELAGVRLRARDFAWPARGPVPVDVQGPLPGGGSLAIKGDLALARPGLDAQVVLRGADLAQVRPYLPLRARVTGKAAGDLNLKLTLEPLAIAARGTAALSDVAVTDGDRTLATAGLVSTTGLDYTWPATAKVDRLLVQRPSVVLERRPDGSLPLAALLAPAGPAAPATPPVSPAPVDVAIREVAVEGGAAALIDGGVSPAARFEVTGTRLVARDVAWPARGPVAVRLRAGTPGGGSVSARGEVALQSRSLDLKVLASGVDVAAARPYLPLRGSVTGKATADLQVHATLEPLAITAQGTASLGDVAFAAGDRPLLTVARMDATGLDYRWPARATIDRLRVQKSWAFIERTPEGGFPLRTLFTAAAPPSAGAAPPSAGGPAPPGAVAPAVDVRLREGVFEDGAATIVDGAVSPAARFDVAGASLSVRDFTWPPKGATRVRLRAPTPGGGTLDARGRLRLDTQRLEGRVLLERVALAPARAYLPVQATVTGTVDADLRVRANLASLAMSAQGKVAVNDAVLGDGRRTLASAKLVEATNLDARWPRRVVVERVVLRQPWALVERERSGAMPLVALLTPPLSAPSPAPATTGAPAPRSAERAVPVVEVTTLAVENGFVRFVDATTSPRFVEEISAIALTARGLGTKPDARSPLALTARLGGGAPVELNGVVGSLTGPLSWDVRGKLTQLPLSRLNPYLDAMIGWIARRGVLSVTFQQDVRDGRLRAEHEVLVEQPEFAPSRRGDAVRERVGLPLPLAVSLMKNAKGEIRLRVPVTGDVMARQFEFDEAMWTAIRKATIGAVALPVSWVGRVFYDEAARIDTIRIWPISFEPGTTRMRRDIDAHAERLEEFLRQAPEVALTMKPVVTVEDAATLAREAVRQRLEALGRQAGQPAPANAAARLFTERFPGRPVPPDIDGIVEALAAEEPASEAAVNALAKRRVEVSRRRLARRGVDAARLRPVEGVVPVESSGHGRVEFEITYCAADGGPPTTAADRAVAGCD
jgi:hypothetical protein